ncbi:hypothetical protein BH23DEI1_BH23DEI1_01580 [soil metagenome]
MTDQTGTIVITHPAPTTGAFGTGSVRTSIHTPLDEGA